MRSVGKQIKKLDQFPEVVQFTIGDGSPEYKTLVGGFFSLLMIISVLAFGTARIVSLLQRSDPATQVTTFEDFYDNNYIFDSGDRIKVAVAIVDN